MAFKFEKLKVWQKALDLADEVDKMTRAFPREEVYILTSQVKRAADSVSMNIAEGSTGQSNPEFKRFLGYALRSDIEVVNCLHLAIRRGYITQEVFEKHYRSCKRNFDNDFCFNKIIKLKIKHYVIRLRSPDFLYHYISSDL